MFGKPQQFPSDTDINLKFVKYGFIYKDYAPTLNDHDESDHLVRYNSVPINYQQKQILFSETEFRPINKKRNSFALIKGSEICKEQFNFANFLLLFYLKLPGTNFVAQYAFLQYLECTKPLNSLGDKLNCVCIR